MNRRPPPCQGDVITPRPRAQQTADTLHIIIAFGLIFKEGFGSAPYRRRILDAILSSGDVPIRGRHDYAGDRRNRPYAGRRDRGLRVQRAGQRAGHVPPSSGRPPPPRGGEPSCGGRRGHHGARHGQGGARARGYRPRVILHGPGPGAVPQGRRDGRKGVRMHAGDTDHRSEPLHRAHRGRSRPHGMQGSGALVRIRREHAGHSVRRGPLQDIRGDAGHRHREHARQARKGPRNGVLRGSRLRGAGPQGVEVLRAPLFGQGHGCRILRHDNGGGGAPQEGGPSGGHSAVRAGDRLRDAHGGHRARHGSHRQEGGAPRRGSGSERPSPRDGRGYGACERRRDVRSRQAVLQGQRRDDRLARIRDARFGRQDADLGHRSPPEIQNG